MDLNDSRALEIFEQRNQAFRVLFDTAVQIEKTLPDELYHVLCSNLRRICGAEWAALATFDSQTQRLTLQSVDSSKHQLDISHDAIGIESTPITADMVENLKADRIKSCAEHSHCIVDIFSSSFGVLEPATYYRLSYVYEDELIAMGMIQLPLEQHLRKKDIIEIYINMTCMIIQRNNTMKRLSESEDRFRKLFEHSNDAIVIFDFYGRIINANSMTQKMSGYGLETIKNMYFYDFFVPEERNKVRAKFDELLAQGHVFFETKYVKKNEAEGDVNISARVIDEDMQLCEAIVRDITIRKRTEKQLKESEERYRVLFDAAAEGIAVMELTKRSFKFVNPALCHMLGYKQDEFLYLKIDHIHPPNAVPEFYDLNPQRALTRNRIVHNVPCLKSDKGLIFVDISFAEARIDELPCMVCFFTDITERKRAEEEISRSHEELEAANEELVHKQSELTKMYKDLAETHGQLKDAQLSLIRSEKLASIGQLAAGIAHEINNPAGFITSNLVTLSDYILNINKYIELVKQARVAITSGEKAETEVLLRKLSKKEQDLDIEYILSDVDNLLRESKEGIYRIKKIVMDLKTFSHQDENSRAVVDVNDVIDGILNIVGNEVKYKANLRTNYSDLPVIKANAQQLGQVFINLLINAGHAIKGKGEISIKTYPHEQQVCVEIADTGSGIAAETHQPYF